MINRNIIANVSRPTVGLPYPPLTLTDPPEVLPTIRQIELVDLADAHLKFQIAKAHYEAKLAFVKMHLLMQCNCEDGFCAATLRPDGKVLLMEFESEGDPVETILS